MAALMAVIFTWNSVLPSHIFLPQSPLLSVVDNWLLFQAFHKPFKMFPWCSWAWSWSHASWDSKTTEHAQFSHVQIAPVAPEWRSSLRPDERSTFQTSSRRFSLTHTNSCVVWRQERGKQRLRPVARRHLRVPLTHLSGSMGSTGWTRGRSNREKWDTTLTWFKVSVVVKSPHYRWTDR